MRPDPRWQALALLFGAPRPTVHAAASPSPAEAGRTAAPGPPGSLGVAPSYAELPPRLAERLEATPPDRLEAEYVRLFVNAMPEVPCPPYASAYLQGTLYGTVTARVRELYRKWGVDTHEVPDHFAVEAAFLAGLLAAAPDDDEALRDLAWLRGHLRSWAPTFLRAVEVHDRTGVYADAARWARGLIEELASPADR